ncbi:hypothetical protein ACTPDI_20435 [Clostridioides difficile]|nr:hypothetical protein [Clostridioides difficile]KJF62425.1 hypothetical protein TZ54_15385 [Clostridioides difficile]
MQKIKYFFTEIYAKYMRSKFRKIIEDNPVSISIIMGLLTISITLFIWIQGLEMKETSQKLPTIVQEVYFIENNKIFKIIVNK